MVAKVDLIFRFVAYGGLPFGAFVVVVVVVMDLGGLVPPYGADVPPSNAWQ